MVLFGHLFSSVHFPLGVIVKSRNIYLVYCEWHNGLLCMLNTGKIPHKQSKPVGWQRERKDLCACVHRSMSKRINFNYIVQKFPIIKTNDKRNDL